MSHRSQPGAIEATEATEAAEDTEATEATRSHRSHRSHEATRSHQEPGPSKKNAKKMPILSIFPCEARGKTLVAQRRTTCCSPTNIQKKDLDMTMKSINCCFS